MHFYGPRLKSWNCSLPNNSNLTGLHMHTWPQWLLPIIAPMDATPAMVALADSDCIGDMLSPAKTDDFWPCLGRVWSEKAAYSYYHVYPISMLTFFPRKWVRKLPARNSQIINRNHVWGIINSLPSEPASSLLSSPGGDRTSFSVSRWCRFDYKKAFTEKVILHAKLAAAELCIWCVYQLQQMMHSGHEMKTTDQVSNTMIAFWLGLHAVILVLNTADSCASYFSMQGTFTLHSNKFSVEFCPGLDRWQNIQHIFTHHFH